ncbi:DUF3618 domain-containing protein [Sphingomonas sp. MA1305]|uniref:DUF3618 domain-containing protein n=1 Tax=Sphingomonas sp. MA1305 TaxID=2479204 RepID=UPI0018E046B7|nr:DUF3618 domain-containing protein [Sphingomonas sp. MA1305]MBI0474593.1 DUF3618 domain-containing protein [Sphingomonas sp. MA1305]
MSAPLEPSARLAAAEVEVAAARARFNGTLSRLQVKLDPRALTRQAAREVVDKGGAAAVAGIETARRNPGAVAGATAVAGLFLARHRIAKLFGRGNKD